MRRSIILLGTAVVAGCGQSATNNAAANMAANSAAAEPPKPAYCFFKDSETKGWKAKTDKSGDVVVTGKAYREDSRYKAVLAPVKVTGTTAEISPTVTVNDTGYAAPDNWWDLTATLPNSQAIASVRVTCGAKTIAELSVSRGK
jgi:hypothetical protein